MAKTIRTIFQGTLSQSPESFQDWALEQIKPLIPFDHCKWGSGIVLNNRATVHTLHLHNLPEESNDTYFKHQCNDAILAKMIANRDKTVTYDRYEITPREVFITLPIYREHCQKYDLEQLISTMVPEPISNLFSVISLSRSRYDRPFSSTEKRIKTMLTPVLTEARSHNIFIHMIRSNRRHSGYSAISDGQGVLREAERLFSESLLEEWPGWEGPKLNFAPEALLQGERTAIFHGEKLNIRIVPLHDLFLLQIEKRSILDDLTAAEQKVSTLLLQGLSDKEIAIRLHISPKTVGHHLQHIYHKTGIPNRAQMAAKFKGKVLSSYS